MGSVPLSLHTLLRSVWDGYIIPQENYNSHIFEYLWKVKKKERPKIF